MSIGPRSRLFLVSAIALLVELALIRWLGSEVRIFAYFNNLILIGCFLGFGLGFFRADRTDRLARSLTLLAVTLLVIGVGTRGDWEYGPSIASRAFSNFADSITMGEQTELVGNLSWSLSGALLWTLLIFLSCLGVLFGYAQRIGSEIASFGRSRRLQAYSWNVAGSLAGILAFSAMARLSMGPAIWFGTAVAATLPLLPKGRRLGGVGALAVVCFVLRPEAGVSWSPYQKLELRSAPGISTILVNGTGYMRLQSLRAAPLAPGELGRQVADQARRGLDRWRLPYTLHGDARRVLVVGAGGGNDVAAALASGAESVVAVEIDPVIHRLGLSHHPDRPYSDPRVEVVVDDARHFAETTDRRFDLVVFSHLDSHTALSGFTNVRLDNYVYTIESFESFRRLLDEGGALYVSFFATQPWVADRLYRNLSAAFGDPPAALYFPTGRIVLAQLFASEDPALEERAGQLVGDLFVDGTPVAGVPPSTDDWPYLFVAGRRAPAPMLLIAAVLGIWCLAVVGRLVRGELRDGGRWPLDRHYFFLGAGFLLLEVHNVSKLARVFGTTWAVNAWVISGILSVILTANVLVIRRPAFAAGHRAWIGLFSSLLLAALVPLETVLSLPAGPFWATGLFTAPLFFAGLIFASSFDNESAPMRALGSNIFGAVVGGLLELVSFSFGLGSLLWLALLLYAAAYRSPDPTRSPHGEGRTTAGTHPGRAGVAVG